MVLDAARRAALQLFSPGFRSVFFKTLGITLLVLVAMWFALRQLFVALALPWIEALLPGTPDWAGWLGLVALVLAGIGLALALALLIAPASAIVAGLFLDDIAEEVERSSYPRDPVGHPLPAMRSLILAIKFFGIVILGNILALLLLLVPGVNLIAFFVVNGYLLSREFFEFAAMRFRSEDEAKAFRRQNAGTVFLGGLVIAGFLAVPLLNLLTPLFATALMVHLNKSLSAGRPLLAA